MCAHMNMYTVHVTYINYMYKLHALNYTCYNPPQAHHIVALTLVHRLWNGPSTPDSVVLHQIEGEVGMVVGDDLRHCVHLTLLHLHGTRGYVCLSCEQVHRVVYSSLAISVEYCMGMCTQGQGVR